MAAHPSSISLKHLPDTHAKLQRLRGMNSDVLRAAGFDSLLEELDAESAALSEVRALNHELLSLCDGLAMLVTMLHDRYDEPLPSTGLYALLEPLAQRFQTRCTLMNDKLF